MQFFDVGGTLVGFQQRPVAIGSSGGGDVSTGSRIMLFVRSGGGGGAGAGFVRSNPNPSRSGERRGAREGNLLGVRELAPLAGERGAKVSMLKNAIADRLILVEATKCA
jgi:hypothetical protein